MVFIRSYEVIAPKAGLFYAPNTPKYTSFTPHQNQYSRGYTTFTLYLYRI